jgi:hypothetical protein
MAIHLISQTRLLAGYESGHVILYEYEGPSDGVTDARLPEVGSSDKKSGRGRWIQRWKIKGHHEAGKVPFGRGVLGVSGMKGTLTQLPRILSYEPCCRS